MRALTTFDFGGRTWGVDFEHLREVVEQLPMTAVPLTPPTVRGVINLRGDLLPVLALDPWLELGTSEAVISRRLWMAVLDVTPYYFGLLVDKVGTASFEGELEEAPAGLGRMLEGVARTSTGFIHVLRLPTLLRQLELGMKNDSLLAA